MVEFELALIALEVLQMDSEEDEPSQSDSKEQKLSWRERETLKRFVYRRLNESSMERLPSSPGSLDPQVVGVLLDYLSSQQKSSDLTKDEVKTLIDDALKEAIKVAEALKPKPGDVLGVATGQLDIIVRISARVLRQADRR